MPGPEYKGNVGNLMQHWTLGEILRIAQANNVQGLNYIDAHAMAPWAATRTDRKINIFDSVRRSLWSCPPGQNSVYERAWNSLARQQNREGYPSSAAFVRQVWKGPYSLLLCEKDRETWKLIAQWLDEIGADPNCMVHEPSNGPIFGDWRRTFKDGLPTPDDVCLPQDSLTLVSFDPYKYDRRSGEDGPGGDLYPEDLVRVLRSLENDAVGEVLLQISTYSVANQGQNAQEAVIRSIDAILSLYEFERKATVRANARVMSLIYTRKVEWAADLCGLSDNFRNWLREVERRMREQV